MTIELYTENIVTDIKRVSHNELSSLYEDVELRYKYEAGTEKENLIMRSLTDAFYELMPRCERFMEPDYSCIGSDGVMTKDAIISLSFVNQERRFINKANIIANALASSIVEVTLHKFYVKVGNSDLAKIHENTSLESILTLETCLYTKRAPSLPSNHF